jgi:hypothetical protein
VDDYGVLEISTFFSGKLSVPRRPILGRQPNAIIAVVVDGARQRIRLGCQQIVVSAGSHLLSIYWPLSPRRARPTMRVEVPAGEVVRLRLDLPRYNWQPQRLTAW